MAFVPLPTGIFMDILLMGLPVSCSWPLPRHSPTEERHFFMIAHITKREHLFFGKMEAAPVSILGQSMLDRWAAHLEFCKAQRTLSKEWYQNFSNHEMSFFFGERFLSSAGAGQNRALSMR